MKKEQLACGNVDKTDKIQDASKDKTQVNFSTTTKLHESVQQVQFAFFQKTTRAC